MANIRIKDATYTADVAHAGKTLSLEFEKARIDEIAALLSEENAPEITVLDKSGRTQAIYRNHALTRVWTETIGGVTRVCAVMQTEEIEQTQADAMREQIEVLTAENEILTECVLEMSAIVYA